MPGPSFHTTSCPQAPAVADSFRSPEIDWLLHALRGEPHWPPTGIGEEQSERLLAAAETNKVQELLFAKLRHSTIWEQLPHQLCSTLTRAHSLAAARELFLEEEIAQDLNALADQGIETLLLKGTALAYSLYPAPGLRPRCDMDLLLRDKATANNAWHILRERGFERAAAISGDFVSHQYSCARHVTPQAGVMLDVHWKLSNSNFFAQKFSFDELLSERVPVAPLGLNAFALSLPHALVHALFHRLWHLGGGEAERLIWIYDIDLICRHFDRGQWARFIALVESSGLGPICQDGLKRTSELLGTPLPDGALERMESKGKVCRRQMMLGQPGWRRTLTDMWSLPSWSQRLRLIRETFIPDRRYMEKRFGVTGYRALTHAYLKRSLRGLRRWFLPHRT